VLRKHAPATTHWERVATTRWGQYVSGIEHQAILIAHGLSGPPASALEVGCEGGRWSQLLVELGWAVTCTDVNKDTLAVCQQRIPTAKCVLVHPDDETLPCPTDSLRLLLCIEVAPVIESEWFLREASRTLSTGGVLVGVFWNRHSMRGLFVRALERFRPHTSFRHYQVPYKRWKATLSARGFEMHQERGLCWFPFSRDSRSLLIPAVVSLERLVGLSRLPNLSPWIVFVAQKAVG
jgi:SAM-dependent methyltransferase